MLQFRCEQTTRAAFALIGEASTLQHDIPPRVESRPINEISVRVVSKGGTVNDFSGRNLGENLLDRAEELGASIVAVAQRLGDQISDGVSTTGRPWNLSGATVRFSVDLEAELGVIVSRAGGSAGFEITLTWTRAIDGCTAAGNRWPRERSQQCVNRGR